MVYVVMYEGDTFGIFRTKEAAEKWTQQPDEVGNEYEIVEWELQE